MVVSEIIDRLSPNIAPHTAAPTHSGPGSAAFCAMPTAIGVSATIVPTDVPIAVETNAAMANSPATAAHGGSTLSPRFTVLSTHPAAWAAPENAPASKKTRHMTITSHCPIAAAARLSRSGKGRPRHCRNATPNAARNGTMAGSATLSRNGMPTPRNNSSRMATGNSPQALRASETVSVMARIIAETRPGGPPHPSGPRRAPYDGRFPSQGSFVRSSQGRRYSSASSQTKSGRAWARLFCS